MIYFENASRGLEGFNTHVMSYTLCTSLSNLLERDFYFDYEIPCSTPPDFAVTGDRKDKFAVLLNSERSLVSDLLVLPNRRAFEIDRDVENKRELQLVYSYFVTTEAMKERFKDSIIWNSFAVGRFDLTREYLLSLDLLEWTHTKASNLGYFYFLPRAEKQALMDSVKIKYIRPIEEVVGRIASQIGTFNAVHLRMGDFLTLYDSDVYSLDPGKFASYVSLEFGDRELPIVVATDGLNQKEIIRSIFSSSKIYFIDEFIMDEYGREFGELPFTDFNVLTVIDQLLCASADKFIGTYRSTFTSVIHRLRQERYGKKDFYFFPDGTVEKLLNDAGHIAADRHGFFDWNRYSAFAEDHRAMAWMREWDHDLTMLDV
ncbi:MAG: O-fucosyltransferase family protein [Acidobacteriota bacterium]